MRHSNMHALVIAKNSQKVRDRVIGRLTPGLILTDQGEWLGHRTWIPHEKPSRARASRLKP